MTSTPPGRDLSVRFQTGIAAMILAMVGASLAAVFLRARSPLEPVADAIMNRTPVSLAIPLLLHLGALSRPLALLGAIAVSMGAGGVLAILYPYTGGRHDHSSSPDAFFLDVLRALLAATGLAAFVLLIFPTGDWAVTVVVVGVYVAGVHLIGRETAYSPSRRAFLLHNARMLGGIGVLVGLLYVGPLVDQFRAQAAGRRLFAWRPPSPRKHGFALEGLTPEVTGQSTFYVMDEDMQQPDVDVQSWSLSIDGLIQRPYSLTFSDLLSMHRRDELVTQECVSNPVGGPLISTALFSGVPVGDLLARGRLVTGARAVQFRSTDGHEESIPLAVARDPSVLLVYARNGNLLEREHGFPARLLIPGIYGYKSVKWVTVLRVTTDPTAGYWESNGWNPLPAVHTTARIDLARAVPGGVLVAGIAFAGRRGIRRVELRANGGPWHGAELHTPALSPFTWVQWRVILPYRGSLTLEARAIDGSGAVQTATPHAQKPNGATGYHTLQVSI